MENENYDFNDKTCCITYAIAGLKALGLLEEFISKFEAKKFTFHDTEPEKLLELFKMINKDDNFMG